MSQELRKVEIFADGVWKAVQFQEMHKGDRFRMFEPTGEPVLEFSVTEFIAESDPYINENVWTIHSSNAD